MSSGTKLKHLGENDQEKSNIYHKLSYISHQPYISLDIYIIWVNNKHSFIPGQFLTLLYSPKMNPKIKFLPLYRKSLMNSSVYETYTHEHSKFTWRLKDSNQSMTLLLSSWVHETKRSLKDDTIHWFVNSKIVD